VTNIFAVSFFRPSVLPSSHLENVDLCENVDGGVARFRKTMSTR